MKVMVLVKASAQSEAGALPDVELMTAMGRYNEALAEAGVMLDGAGLLPSRRGLRLRFGAAGVEMEPGPFGQLGELVSGWWLWKVESLDQALEWVRRAPFGEGVELELRPVAGEDDFAEVLTDELRESCQRLQSLLTEPV